ncbi:MAG: endonuclease domain-containing protein [Rhodoferax sp.]|nr:endonuclease domain-containing protein [Rhodoferax sp.]
MLLNNRSALRTYRKELRNNLTPAEAKLWTQLKGSQLDGRKFRRQHSVGRYILDFYCPAERLAIELDGGVHDTADAQAYDRERDMFLQALGIKVLRFENRLVFQQLEGVLAEVKSQFGDHPAPATTPATPATTPATPATTPAATPATTPPLRGTPP